MSLKKLLPSILAIAFKAHSGYEDPAADDPVEIVDDWMIAAATEASDAYVGHVELVSGYDVDKNITVRTRFTDCRLVTLSETVVAGKWIVPAGSNTYRAYNSGTDSILACCGMLVEGGDQGDEVHALVY